ncbi:flagellar basal-body rod protein FlgC [Desulfotomaculum nigrificans CO-1-SRB]|uniref:Flagellar basal-body rod protein FlgC n=1 Tax=Desulfotomaculum nigrificans (strain DSM 14880 / VKM B-2319 / CO-1-SRB) TaxID=868595 RepID=F6B810_DESCC|nr:flagellar basal body rod protein FlgC [Desulfotomaculum nigrificans]AEF94647.1 flagellar basal-body rod protein FlgC [Desulfotomaculum nigrificans CO-1-SRB]
MGLFDSFAISASGMTSERLRLDLIANNVANMNTAGRPNDPNNPVYRRRVPVFAEQLRQTMAANSTEPRGAGVRVKAIVEDPAPPRIVHEPDNPLADQDGNVAYPNINIVNEMVDMITASRAYEANVTALNAAKSMALKALEISRG